jgi:hypothetical protein
MPLAVYASRYLPWPESPFRANEPLGHNRRETIFRWRHQNRQIPLRGINIHSGRRVADIAADWAVVDFALGQLIQRDGDVIGAIEACVVNPAAAAASQPKNPPMRSARALRRDQLLLAASGALGSPPEPTAEQVWKRAREDNPGAPELGALSSRQERRIWAALK